MTADDILIENENIIGNNLYAYCMNNPINLSDPNGNLAISAFIKTVGNLVKKAVQTVATAVAKALPDYSQELNKVVLQNAYEMIAIKEQFGMEVESVEFYNSVKKKARWDYKVEANWNDGIDLPFLEYDGHFIYNGAITTAEEFGNIHYGFVGSAIGFPPTALFIGGGYANIGISIKILKKPYYGDNIDDHSYIQRGIDMYNQYFR